MEFNRRKTYLWCGGFICQLTFCQEIFSFFHHCQFKFNLNQFENLSHPGQTKDLLNLSQSESRIFFELDDPGCVCVSNYVFFLFAFVMYFFYIFRKLESPIFLKTSAQYNTIIM